MREPHRERIVDAYTADRGVTHTFYSGTKGQEGRIPIPTHWPSVPSVDAEVEWNELREWVEDLKQRFRVLDHHVIPACWWRHNEHVEALCALRDHERTTYSDLAAATGPVEWMGALRDIAELLTKWTGELSCGALHQPPLDEIHGSNYEGWEQYWHADRDKRETNAIEAAAARDGAAGGESAEK